jgi:L-lysine exporter family protein LysE/ArgO
MDNLANKAARKRKNRSFIFKKTDNPHALLDTVGVIGSNSLLYSGETKIWFTLAAILVSWVWFFFLAFAGRFVQTIDSSGKTVYLLNKSAALIIWGIVIYMIIHSF